MIQENPLGTSWARKSRHVLLRRGLMGRPRTHWRDYVSQLAWNHLGVSSDELEKVAGERQVRASLLPP